MFNDHKHQPICNQLKDKKIKGAMPIINDQIQDDKLICNMKQYSMKYHNYMLLTIRSKDNCMHPTKYISPIITVDV